MDNTISPEVSASIRADIAAAREHAELVDAIDGSPLWWRLVDDPPPNDMGREIYYNDHGTIRVRTEFDWREP